MLWHGYIACTAVVHDLGGAPPSPPPTGPNSFTLTCKYVEKS